MCSSDVSDFKERFFLSLALFCWLGHEMFLGLQFKSSKLGNPKAAAHVAVDLQYRSL